MVSGGVKQAKSELLGVFLQLFALPRSAPALVIDLCPDFLGLAALPRALKEDRGSVRLDFACHYAPWALLRLPIMAELSSCSGIKKWSFFPKFLIRKAS